MHNVSSLIGKTRYELFKNQDADENLFDVTFLIDGMTIRAHKFILGSASSVFKCQFSSRWIKTDDKAIKIHQFTYKTFYDFVEYFYTGTFKLNDYNFHEIAEISNFYNVLPLQKLCKNYLKDSQYKPENFILFANCFIDHTLFDESFRAGMMKNYSKWLKMGSSKFNQALKPTVQAIVETQRPFKYEEQLITAVFEWAKNVAEHIVEASRNDNDKICEADGNANVDDNGASRNENDNSNVCEAAGNGNVEDKNHESSGIEIVDNNGASRNEKDDGKVCEETGNGNVDDKNHEASDIEMVNDNEDCMIIAVITAPPSMPPQPTISNMPVIEESDDDCMIVEYDNNDKVVDNELMDVDNNDDCIVIEEDDEREDSELMDIDADDDCIVIEKDDEREDGELSDDSDDDCFIVEDIVDKADSGRVTMNDKQSATLKANKDCEAEEGEIGNNVEDECVVVYENVNHGDDEIMTETTTCRFPVANHETVVQNDKESETVDENGKETGTVFQNDKDTGTVDGNNKDTGTVDENNKDTGTVFQNDKDTGTVDGNNKDTGTVDENGTETEANQRKDDVAIALEEKRPPPLNPHLPSEAADPISPESKLYAKNVNYDIYEIIKNELSTITPKIFFNAMGQDFVTSFIAPRRYVFGFGLTDLTLLFNNAKTFRVEITDMEGKKAAGALHDQLFIVDEIRKLENVRSIGAVWNIPSEIGKSKELKFTRIDTRRAGTSVYYLQILRKSGALGLAKNVGNDIFLAQVYAEDNFRCNNCYIRVV